MTIRPLAFLSLVLAAAPSLAAGPVPFKVITRPSVTTDRMGGIDHPDRKTLLAMHRSQYILHARAGTLTRKTVQRIVIPHDDGVNPQSTQVSLSPSGTVYIRQAHIICRSADGGRTWKASPFTVPESVNTGWRWKVLRDGSFLTVGCKHGKDARTPATVWRSTDEAQTWKKLATIPLNLKLPGGKPYSERYVHRGLEILSNGTLLWSVDVRGKPGENAHGLYMYRSLDNGRTWQGPTLIHDWASEGASTLLPSGRIVATVRYQRPTHPSDPGELERNNRSISKGWPWKNVFLIDSLDGGKTWTRPRQLTTVFGQTFGYPVSTRNGTLVVIHDTRYGPGLPGSRAIVSHDEGKTWQDEVYYLDVSKFTGSYSASVTLKDDTILTISGSSQAGNSWAAVNTTTDFHAIRWKPSVRKKAAAK